VLFDLGQDEELLHLQPQGRDVRGGGVDDRREQPVVERPDACRLDLRHGVAIQVVQY